MPDLEIIKEQNRIRARRYYDKKKQEISVRRKEKRVSINEIVKQFNSLNINEQELPNKSEFIKISSANKDLALKNLNKKMATKTNKVIDTSKEAVINAMKSTDYYTNEATRKTNLQQIPLIFRATNGEPLLNWLKPPDALIGNVKNLKQKSGEPYSLTGTTRILGAILAIIKFMKLSITKGEDKILFDAYRTAKFHYDIELYIKKHPTLNESTSIKSYNDVIKDVAKQYGIKSLNYLIAMLYKYAPLRNDYSNMVMIQDKKDVEPNVNYMIVPTTGNASILIQNHKTKKTNGDINYTFPSDATELIKNTLRHIR
jgi:hypothetical protein